MAIVKCRICPNYNAKDMRALYMHYRNSHPEILEKLGWPKIKSDYLEEGEKKEIKKIEEKEKKALEPKLKSYDDSAMRGMPLPQDVEVAYDETKSDLTPGQLTHKIKIDPRLNILYEYLKRNEKIPQNWKMSDFINNYVTGHVKSKDGLNLSITQEIMGGEGKRVVMMEGEKVNDQSIDPVKELERMKKEKFNALAYKKLLKELGEEEKKETGKDSMFGEMSKMIDSLVAKKMAMKFIDKIFAEDQDNGKQYNSEVEKLKDQLAKVEEEKKFGEIKNSVESLKESIKNTSSTKDITSKDLFSMFLMDKKKADDMKDMINNKNIEILKQANENQTKMLADRLSSLQNRPNAAQQLKELQETAKAFESSGMFKGAKEKSNTEILSDLVGNVANTVTSSPGFQKFLANSSVGQQEGQYTSQQQAQINQAHMQTTQQPSQSPQNSQPAKEVQVTNPDDAYLDEIAGEDPSQYDGLINVSDFSDSPDRKKRR